MTEFAACRRDNLCQQCRAGRTSAKEHPWQRWSEAKRENVLNRLGKALVNNVECGWGIAYTKEDYDLHVRTSPARAISKEPVGDEYLTFAVQQCGGQFAKWRAQNERRDRLKFVFDTSSKKEKREISEVFFAGVDGEEKYKNGVEQWFDHEPDGVSFENRRVTHQLLAPDMVAWTIASIRARELTLKGRFVELFQLGKIFVESDCIKIGYTIKRSLEEWEWAKLDAAGPGTN